MYTKTADSVFRALSLATKSVNILHYSLQVPPSERRQTRVSCEQNALLYLVDLFINKLKTKFNNIFLQNDFEYKNNSQLLLKKFSRKS